MLFVANI